MTHYDVSVLSVDRMYVYKLYLKKYISMCMVFLKICYAMFTRMFATLQYDADERTRTWVNIHMADVSTL